jgi:hypothetical protein
MQYTAFLVPPIRFNEIRSIDHRYGISADYADRDSYDNLSPHTNLHQSISGYK